MLITPNRSWPTVYTIDDNDKRFLYTPSSQSTFQDSFEVFIKDAQLFICWWSLYPLRHAVCWGFCSFSSFVWITLHLLHVDLSSSRSPKHCGVNSSYLMSTLVWLVITVCSFCPFPDLNLFLLCSSLTIQFLQTFRHWHLVIPVKVLVALVKCYPNFSITFQWFLPRLRI